MLNEISNKFNEVFFVHDTAIIDSTDYIGKGTKIWHYSHILNNTTSTTSSNSKSNKLDS